MASFRKLLASFVFSSTAVVAQMPDMHPPRVDIAVLLNLDAARAQQVHAIMKQSHERIAAARAQIGLVTDETSRSVMRAAMDAIHAETHSQLAAVLTPEELDKVHAALPLRPHVPRGIEG
jgi:hypothetical protein